MKILGIRKRTKNKTAVSNLISFNFLKRNLLKVSALGCKHFIKGDEGGVS
jgi:hypothetical protein